jgi:hypothetical protein
VRRNEVENHGRRPGGFREPTGHDLRQEA